ncbi:MAG: 1,2-phenylacetyl-CoA epoxidase subunit B [Bacteroidetes bacterium]|nr:1,2-phenylacetyl-CoA epoxidase subunit B [Bacteroidota bacterium]MBL0018835.1 1,2-phenylacetyl-CoA epoxidase subunit B [Bacteroidota bacterium]MBP6640204.1 1,2-phenylacetyl-CoA epoxidase subunit B [Bacteroidia bacterium]MBP6721209.1 1,2-phenylacetyl-CoA epoxidase subunit B [Bacteroidia bacterium]MBP8073417.1 1,2-phenylacetyl-CoA epoxidase subunit B [Bacteroidia bacterium]
MKINSLDPRISRSDLPEENEYSPKVELDQFETYEVFHQTSRGAQHVHVGSVHAPNAELALIFAKEQYARRMKCVNLWVAKTSAISATSYDDSDMFEPALDKSYREAFGYKNKHIIQKFNAEQNLQNSQK